MHALILAAGLGWRLGGGETQPPKSLIRFGGQSLLERSVRILLERGVEDVTVGVGYRAEAVATELAGMELGARVRTVYNPDFHEGNLVTLWHLRAQLARGRELLLMDADVLYHRDIMARLVASRHPNAFLMDRDIEPGDEPVKLCVRGERLVGFAKQVPANLAYDFHGESVGFFKLARPEAERLGELCEAYLAAGRRDAFYEDALLDLLLERPGRFGYEDITGLPWIEIDFQEDIRRAEREVMPRIEALEAA